MANDPRPREVRDAALEREQLTDEYVALSRMKPADPVITDLITELRVKLAAKVAAGEAKS